MTITRTVTRTHVEVTFSDPYKTCATCGSWVTGWHDVHACGCTSDSREDYLTPCGHHGEVVDRCPSWSPVDGCQCTAMLGAMAHLVPPRPLFDVDSEGRIW